MSHSSVIELVRKAERAGLKWLRLPEHDEEKLEELLYPTRSTEDQPASRTLLGPIYKELTMALATSERRRIWLSLARLGCTRLVRSTTYNS